MAYGIKPEHGCKIVRRVVILQIVRSKTELDESCANEEIGEKHFGRERGCIDQYTQECKEIQRRTERTLWRAGSKE